MSFVLNGSQQLSLFDALGFLSQRKQRMLEKSWAQTFSDKIFQNIDEMKFAPLYSDKLNSRPNAPVNVIVGALILKELFGLTDDEVMDSCEFDFRYQYALHTTSFETQPISDRTFSRFRSRCAAYELTTGVDLIHDCMKDLSKQICEFMGLSDSIKRMDSMMIESNIRKMGRLELLYTCLANLVREIHRDGRDDLLEGLEHYEDPNDRNRVIYHDTETPQAQRLKTVIDDAGKLLPGCKEEYEHTEDYQLLLRAIEEQTKPDPNDPSNNRVSKTSADDMDATVLQNPSDPDATYRFKAGHQHRGYSANLTETVDINGSVVTDYQYDVNTRSDASFIKEAIENEEKSEESCTLIADGAYNSQEIRNQAIEKNIHVITTGLTGNKPKDILADFIFSEDGKCILKCAGGHEPKSSCYIPQSKQIRVSFQKCHCENCPLKAACNPAFKVRTTLLTVSYNGKLRAEELRFHKNDPFYPKACRIRNGVETVPSIIRNKFNVDKMPVRGKLRTKQFFGFKIGALNFIKLLRYERGQSICRALLPE